MFHLQHGSASLLRHNHELMPFIDRPFTNGTLVGENISNKTKTKIKSAIIPSKTDIVNAIDKQRMERRERNVSKMGKKNTEAEIRT